MNIDEFLEPIQEGVPHFFDPPDPPIDILNKRWEVLNSIEYERYVSKEKWFSNPKKWWWFTCQKVSSYEFYRDLFPEGSFEPEFGKLPEYPKTNKGNGFIVYDSFNSENEKRKRTSLIFDDLCALNKYLDNPCAFLSPVAYFGKNRTLANARLLFALTFDLDGVGADEIDNFFGFYLHHKRLPEPTYVVNSGGGIHLYYLFEEPIALIPKNQIELKKLKYALTSKIWNVDLSKIENPQYQGINQGFRLVGGLTKAGERVTAYKIGSKVSIDYLNSFVDEKDKAELFGPSKLTLEQAKEKYPEWYKQRIEQGREKKSWICKRDLYDWWLRKAPKAVLHHRYFYIMCLAIYAVKCGIDFEELERDAYGLVDLMNKVEPAYPFLESDVKSALDAYQESYKSFPRDEISKLSAIDIPKNKRNGRTQEKHLAGARAIRDINNENWRDGNGRKPYKDAVFKFLDMYPKSSVDEFITRTGMSRRVFYKYKKEWLSKK